VSGTRTLKTDQEISHAKTDSNALVVSLLAVPLAAGAAGKDRDKYQIRPPGNLRTILEQEIDMPVKLRLKSGQELSGAVVQIPAGGEHRLWVRYSVEPLG
jgi:hypothetical protein